MLIRKYKEQYHWLACLFGHACFDATLAAKAKRCRKCIDNWHHSPTKTLSRAISHIYINTASKDTTWPICLVCKQFNFCTRMQNSLQGHTLIQTLFLSFSNDYNCPKCVCTSGLKYGKYYFHKIIRHNTLVFPLLFSYQWYFVTKIVLTFSEIELL